MALDELILDTMAMMGPNAKKKYKIKKKTNKEVVF
jgi:hypothetical protein